MIRLSNIFDATSGVDARRTAVREVPAQGFDVICAGHSYFMDTIATRYSFWGVLRPMSALHEPLPFARTFTREEFDVIARGLVPTGMDDRWFIFLESDQLYFHRSWTGTCIYQITLDSTDRESIVVTNALVNRNPDEYRIADDQFDVALLRFLIDSLLLGQPAQLPVRNSNPTGA